MALSFPRVRYLSTENCQVRSALRAAAHSSLLRGIAAIRAHTNARAVAFYYRGCVRAWINCREIKYSWAGAGDRRDFAGFLALSRQSH